MGQREVDGGEDDQHYVGRERQDLPLLREEFGDDPPVAHPLRDEVDGHRDKSEKDDVSEDEDSPPYRVYVYETREEEPGPRKLEDDERHQRQLDSDQSALPEAEGRHRLPSHIVACA